jgi:UDP-galactopyranose mutase
MTSHYDYLIVGSGLTGATIARILFDKGFKVLIIERRSHLGGNVHDHVHESGIRVHTYGPHYFRTSDEKIWRFVNRFSSFYNYVASIKTLVDGQHENWPVSAAYIKRHVGVNWKPSFQETPRNFEEAALSLMPELIYTKFVRGYNIKQWGVEPKNLSSQLIKRFDVRKDNDERLMPKHKYQGLPDDGYAKFMENMLKGIPVLVNVDYMNTKEIFAPKKMVIYTGPIDEYFNYNCGKLKYRGQIRKHTYLPGINFKQPCAQINNPSLDNGPHIRTIEWKHLMKDEFRKNIVGTVLTTEVTVTPDSTEDYEYPFPDQENAKLYQKYREQATLISDLLICGRLGEYQYYDMDQVIGRAFKLVESRILHKSEQDKIIV